MTNSGQFKSFLADNQDAVYAGGTAVGQAVQSYSKPTNMGMQVAGSALSGAAMGTAIMPGIGTAVGAVAGAATGYLKASKEQEAMNNAKALAARVRKQQTSREAMSVANQFSNENIKASSYVYEKGGFLVKNAGGYLVEDGELIYSKNKPKTNKHGKAVKIAPNTYKFIGDLHKDKSGGIGVTGGKSSFVDNTGNYLQSGFVLSNKLKTDAQPFLNFKKFI